MSIVVDTYFYLKASYVATGRFGGSARPSNFGAFHKAED